YKMVNDKKSKGQDRGKPYAGNGKKRDVGGSSRKNVKCFRCGAMGHHVDE
ncbi:hypothetical protein A2U01_0108956, partial [Trifolium medium]|nr:hypothetical protein [Trifolium medium]